MLIGCFPLLIEGCIFTPGLRKLLCFQLHNIASNCGTRTTTGVRS